jgi:flagellar biosynthetic protein FlhB
VSGQDDDVEREHEPSQRKLDEARKKGDVPRSMELTTAAVYAGLVLALFLTGRTAAEQAGAAGVTLLGQADRLAPAFMQAGSAPTASMLMSFVLPFAAIFALPLVAALLGAAGQRSLVFAPEKLMPQLSRLSLIATFRQKFGREGLFEFGKSFVKMIVIGVLVVYLVIRHAPDLLLSLQLAPGQSIVLMSRIMMEFLMLALLTTLVFGGLDYGWQILQHRRRNRMSRQELVDEHKESDGDPHLKFHRRQRGREIAMNQMLQDVAKADVIIVNPTHYAVALKWKRGDKTAPICVAKGVDDIAARIREKAAEVGIPIHQDPPAARAIYASVEIGASIRPEHFKAVAAAIRFAEMMRKKARAMRK